MKSRDRVRTMLRLSPDKALPPLMHMAARLHRRLPSLASVIRVTHHSSHEAGSDDLISLCEVTARRIRSGQSPATALIGAIERTVSHDPVWRSLAREIAVHHDLTDILHWAESHAVGHTQRCLALLRASLVDRYMHASALDHAAQVMRDTAAFGRQVRSATAQVHTSVRILTGIPWVVCAAAWMFSVNFRDNLLRPSVVVPLLCGSALNVIARRVLRRMAARLEREAETTTGTPARLADDVAVGLLAGLTPAAAVRRLADSAHPHMVGSVVAARLDSGMPFERALAPMQSARGHHHIAELLLSAHTDGVPSAETATELARDAHLRRQLELEEMMRALPVRMTLPLTALALPSFLLIAVVPLLTSGMSSMKFPAAPM